MANIDRRSGLIAGLAALGLAWTASTAAAAPAPEQTQGRMGADFVCHGFTTQTCHFAVLRQRGPRMDFALASGATRHLTDIAMGTDRYMVTVNALPPENALSCSRTPAPGKRSTWCKLSTVSFQLND